LILLLAGAAGSPGACEAATDPRGGSRDRTDRRGFVIRSGRVRAHRLPMRADVTSREASGTIGQVCVAPIGGGSCHSTGRLSGPSGSSSSRPCASASRLRAAMTALTGLISSRSTVTPAGLTRCSRLLAPSERSRARQGLHGRRELQDTLGRCLVAPFGEAKLNRGSGQGRGFGQGGQARRSRFGSPHGGKLSPGRPLTMHARAQSRRAGLQPGCR
jgi:hypothetical protein